MAVFLFKAVTRNPQTGQLIMLPAGANDSFVINMPHGASQNDVKMFAAARGFGVRGVRYVIAEVTPGEPEVLCVQPFTGISAQSPQLSAQHVNGGQPVGAPQGQLGQNRASTEPDSSGFQRLGDDALDTGEPAPYGSGDDFSGSDIIQSGGQVTEIPRQ